MTIALEPGESTGKTREDTTKVVPIGGSLVVDVTGHLAAPQHNDDSGERLLVVLTPQIIVNEPEEAAHSDVLRAVRR